MTDTTAAELGIPTPTPAPTKTRVEYVDANSKPCALAQAYGLMVTGSDGDVVWPVPLSGATTRMYALFGMYTLATQAVRKANAPIAEVDARFAKVTDTAWGDEKPVRLKAIKKVPLTKEEKLALDVEALLSVVAACKAAQGKPIQDMEVARAKLLSGDPAKGISGEKFRRDLRRDPSVAAEILRRKATSAPPAPDGLSAL